MARLRPRGPDDAGYEAGARAAEFVGAKVVRVALCKDYAHDVKAMAALRRANARLRAAGVTVV